MRSPVLAIGLVVGLTTVLFAMQRGDQTPPAVRRQAWEYKVISILDVMNRQKAAAADAAGAVNADESNDRFGFAATQMNKVQKGIDAELNRLGADGWQLVAVEDNGYYLRRPARR